MSDKRALLRHFLATLAYRTQKALGGAPESFGGFEAGEQVRTPAELVRHMTDLMGYTGMALGGRPYQLAEPLPNLTGEVARFHEMLEDVARLLTPDTELTRFSEEQLLQGPLADAMTHAGQLALLRRLAGSPVPPESFIDAAVDPGNLGPNQPKAVSLAAALPQSPRSSG